MPTKITYNGKTTEVSAGDIATIACKDYQMATDVVVEAPESEGESAKLYGIEVTPTKDIQNIVPEDDYDGFDEVIVNPIPDEYVIPSLQEKTATENGEVTADEGYTGLSKVTVNVPSEEPNLISKTITENGTYKASEEVDDGTIVGTWVLNDVVTSDSVSVFNINGRCYYGSSYSKNLYKPSLTISNTSANPALFIDFYTPGDRVMFTSEGWRSKTASSSTTYYTPNPKLVIDGLESGDTEVLLAWLKANAKKTASTTTVDGYSEVIVNVEPALEELTATANGEYTPSGDGYSKVTVSVEAEDSAIPIEVATEAEMTALLTSGEVGGVYKYTGTTGTYENGALYLLETSGFNLTLSGSYSTSGVAGQIMYVKLNSQPTSDSDYDYDSKTLYENGSVTVQASSYWRWTSNEDYTTAIEVVLTEDKSAELGYIVHTGGSND